MSAARAAVASFLLAAAAPPLLAADPGSGAANGQQCVPIEDATARLACYDHAFGRSAVPAGAASAAGAASLPATVAPPTQPASDAARAIDEFGLSEVAKRKRDPERAKETMPESIAATVAQVGRRPTGEVVVTLDNAQVWEQAEAVTVNVRLKAGDAVTIRKAALGSYTMLTPGRMVIRVRRVR